MYLYHNNICQQVSQFESTEEKKTSNGIKISPWAATSDRDNYYWWIDVDVNGAKKRSPFKYNGKQINAKIFELYKFYYKKYVKQL